MKVKEEFTPARRWSFLVGANEKSHTAQSRLVNILANDEQAPSLEEIEKAFDIEAVTKEFFLKYRELFLHTKEELDRIIKKDPKIKADFEEKSVDTVNFAKKLLGQIVFLYFLQKKGWFGVDRDRDWGTGSKHFLRELFEKKHSEYKNFYNDILEPLFYEALRMDRSHDDGYYSRFDCKIPFLNGGLFDPIGNYDWVHTDIIIPDKLFSNTRKTKEGDTGDGILDIFDRYNFTVKEDEPLEKEVAIDPELLGKAYEKFNAIRPDNFDEFKRALKSGRKGEENKFNKKFGVYYTPSEIVHYMCQQSLINYLTTGLEGKVSKEDIETLIHTGDQISENEVAALIKEQNIKEGKQKTSGYKLQLPESIRSNAALIDDKLADITVCDPAVGSGAFPVGMMSEIVRTRNVLSVFLDDNSRTAYEFKRRCIEHSLYGVDIDPGAVEIAKLRLWLSLMVDEDDINHIKPLPNLDYKVVCGNSLLGVEKDLFNAHLFLELEKLKPLFFNETNPTKKQEYKKLIDKLISEITSGHTEFDFEVYFSEVFHHKGGFDVVIANPPYIGEKANSALFEKLKKLERWKSFYRRRTNTYYFFIKQGIDIQNNSGCLTYIVPREFLTADWANKLRAYIMKKARIHRIIDFDDTKVFEDAGTSSLILILKWGIPELYSFYVYRPNFTGDFKDRDIQFTSSDFNITSFESKSLDITGKDLWTFYTDYFPESKSITSLGSIFEVSQGLVTGADRVTNKHIQEEYISKKYLGRGIFILKEGIDIRFRDGSTELKLYNTWKKIPLIEKKYIKPYISSNNLVQWHIKISKEWIIYFGDTNYHKGLVYDYLKQFKLILINRSKIDKNKIITSKEFANFSINDVKNIYSSAGAVQKIMKKKSWYLPLYERVHLDFSEPKIIVNTKRMFPFTYSDSMHLSSGGGLGGQNYIFLRKKKDSGYCRQIKASSSVKDFIKYTNAVLNSKLIYHTIKAGRYNQLSTEKIKEIKFLKIDFHNKDVVLIYKKIIGLVDNIIDIHIKNNKYSDFNSDPLVLANNIKIDQLVYKLYGLNRDEIAIIEGKKK